MNFAYPKILYLLFLIPIFFILHFLSSYKRRKKIEKFGKPHVLTPLISNASPAIKLIKTSLEIIAIAAVIFALARPRANEMEKTESANGIEIVVALDVSKSMDASATDNAKGVSRLNRAKLLINKIIDELDENRIGLVLFAGSAYTQLPITNDFISARVFLDDITTSSVQTQGTNIASAIEKSMASFSDFEDINKAIILITDSENHEPGALEMAQKAADAGIEVDIIGVGSMGKVPIPINNRGEYLKDFNGTTVTTALDEQMARQLAEKGKGEYINGSASDAVSQLSSRINQLEKKELGEVKYKASAERFPLFIWIAIFAILLDFAFLERKYAWMNKFDFFKINKK